MASLHLNSTDILRILAEVPDRHLLLERAVPRGRLKRDMITMKESDGHDVTVTDAERRSFFQVEVPIETINDFLRAGFVRQIGHDDGGAEVMFCLTDDGRDRGERAA